MTLTTCAACGKQVSTQAVACPGCGHPGTSALTASSQTPAGAGPLRRWNRKAVASAVIPVPVLVLVITSITAFSFGRLAHGDSQGIYEAFIGGYVVLAAVGLFSALLGAMGLRDTAIRKTGEKGVAAAVIGLCLSLAVTALGVWDLIKVLGSGPPPSM